MISDERISEATEKAMDSFWESVVESFPKALAGDLSPLTTIHFSETCERAVREWAEANADDSERKDVRRVTIPAGGYEVIHVSPETVAAVEAELGTSDTGTWCDCDDSHVPVDYRDDGKCDCRIKKHHYHCTVCGGVFQVG